MKNLYQRLLLLIAGATQLELARRVCYLKIENEILRSKLLKRVKFGAKLRKALRELMTIVHPDTLRRWIRDSKQTANRKPVKKGRPRTQEQLRDLILKVARENDWGYTRILGELKKLGITPPSRNTVKNILKGNGLDLGPKRGAGTWDEFLKIHAVTLWQFDFYSKKVLTLKGFRDLYLLIFLHVETRRVFIAPATYHPNEAWVKEQAEAFLKHAKETGSGTALVMHDRDTKFTAAFDDALRAGNVKVQVVHTANLEDELKCLLDHPAYSNSLSPES